MRTKICKSCNEIFYTDKRHSKICAECKQEMREERRMVRLFSSEIMVVL
jgi:hypothetical protein